MPKWLKLFSILSLMQCTPKGIDELRLETPVMIAIVPNGSATGGIQLFNLTDGDPWGTPIQDATITIEEVSTGNFANLTSGSGGYTADFQIETGQRYTLAGRVQDHDFSTEIEIPPSLEFAIELNDTISINAASIGSSVAIVTWTELDENYYSYVVRMDCLEEFPLEIPFNVNSGNFAANFNGPQVAPGIIIVDTDFKYYGKHKFTVFAIPKLLERVYFYNAGDIRGLLTNGPDNIVGIKGFATGMSVLEKEVYLKPL